MSNSLKESDDGLCRSFDVKASLLPFFQGQKVEFIDNEDQLTTLYDGNFKIVQATSGAPVFDLFDYNDEHREIVTSFCMHPSKREVVVATSKFLLKHYNLEDKSCIRSIRGHNMPIICMSYDCTGQLVATGSSDRVVRVWDIEKGYCTHNFRNHTEVVTITKFHPMTSQMKLFSASDDTTIKCYDLTTQKCIANFQDHYHTPTGIELSPLGNVLVSVSRDKVINFYNLVTMTIIKTLPISEELEGLVVLSASHTADLLGYGKSADSLGSDKSADFLGFDNSSLGSSRLSISGGGSSKKNNKSKSSSSSDSSDAPTETFTFLTAGQESVIRMYKVSINLSNKELFSCEAFFELRVGIPSETGSTNALQSMYYLRNKGQIVVASSELNLHRFSISKATSATELGHLELDIHLSGGNDDILDIVSIPPLIENNNSSNSNRNDDDDDSEENVSDDGSGEEKSSSFRLAIVTNSNHVKIVSDQLKCKLLFGHEDTVLAACASPDG
jgi:WD40 repeat protein